MVQEIWKVIPRFNGRYEASNLGKIRTVCHVVIKSDGKPYTSKQKELKPALNHSGYFRFAVKENDKLTSFYVARIIAETFIDNLENKLEVNHINGIKTDNRVGNLEWCTRSENCQHSFDTGKKKKKRGVLNGMSKLTWEQVRYIREQKRIGGMYWGRERIAKELGISSAHVKDIANNPNIWKED